MGKRAWGARLIAAVLLLALGAGISVLAAATEAQKVPLKMERQTGISVQANQYAQVDLSNLAEGYVLVTWLGDSSAKLKVIIAKTGGTKYTYNLNAGGRTEVFPLTDGDGAYTVSVFKNISGTKYAQSFSCSAELKLRNEFLPFLYANQYVNFTEKSSAVKKAAELTRASKTDLECVQKIYGYVIQTLTYDKALAKTVKSGYLPDLEQVMTRKKGICFDYAALMTAMLRSCDIPCKLVIGYAGTAYHAWINVYIEGKGWVDKLIYFDGEDWTLMDPTFASSLGQNSASLEKYLGDGKNYTEKYAY